MIGLRDRSPSVKVVASAYNERFALGGFRESESFYRWVLRKLRPRPGTRLLDMSCGEGHLLKESASGYAQHVHGIDISSVALRLSQERAPGARLAQCDGVSLPHKANTFDYVTNLGSLEHYSDIRKGVTEIVRVLKPKGRAAILLPNSYYLVDIMWWVWRTGYGPSHKQILETFATAGEWRDLLEEGGLKVRVTHAYNFCFPRTSTDWNWYTSHRSRFLNLLASVVTPANLAYAFLFIAEKPDR